MGGWRGRGGVCDGAGHRLGVGMNAADFIRKWGDSTLRERQASQSHFNDLCALIGEKTPTEADPFPVNSQADRQAQVQSLEAPLDGLLQQRLPSSDPEASPAAAPNPLLETSATVEPLPMRGRGFRGFR